MYRLIVFDMDGTLADTSEGILDSHRYTLKMMGRNEPTEKDLEGIIGGNLLQVYIERFNFPEIDAKRAVRIYREYYAQFGIYQAKLYPNIPELLTSLKESGIKLGVATLKAERFAKIMLSKMGVEQLFDCIFGIDENDSRTKAELIHMCIKNTGVPATETVLIGDSQQDQLGAIEAGVDFIGVSYGYGFQDSGVKNVSDLFSILLQEKKE